MWVALVQGCVFRLFCRACICSLCNCDSFYKPLWFLHCESHRQTSVSGKSSPSGLWSEHSHPKHCGLWCYVWSIKHCGLWCYDWSIIIVVVVNCEPHSVQWMCCSMFNSSHGFSRLCSPEGAKAATAYASAKFETQSHYNKCTVQVQCNIPSQQGPSAGHASTADRASA